MGGGPQENQQSTVWEAGPKGGAFTLALKDMQECARQVGSGNEGHSELMWETKDVGSG